MYPTLTVTDKPQHGLAPCGDCHIWVCLRCHVCPRAGRSGPARPD